MQRLSILIYHRIPARRDPMFPEEQDAESFEGHVRMLARTGTILPLGEALARLREGRLPPVAYALTFDDGYADNAEVALPILKRLKASATFFIATGFLDGGCMWNDRVIEAVRGAAGPVLELEALGLGTHAVPDMPARRAAAVALVERLKYLPLGERLEKVEALAERLAAPRPKLMMTRAQVRELAAAGMQIGGHTVNHPILAVTDAGEARREIGEGRDSLEAITGDRISLFAYPNGRPRTDYLAEHVEMVRGLGFAGAVSTARGVGTRASDPLQLPRLTPWPRKPLRLAVEVARNLARTRSDRV